MMESQVLCSIFDANAGLNGQMIIDSISLPAIVMMEDTHK